MPESKSPETYLHHLPAEVRSLVNVATCCIVNEAVDPLNRGADLDDALEPPFYELGRLGLSLEQVVRIVEQVGDEVCEIEESFSRDSLRSDLYGAALDIVEALAEIQAENHLKTVLEMMESLEGRSDGRLRPANPLANVPPLEVRDEGCFSVQVFHRSEVWRYTAGEVDLYLFAERLPKEPASSAVGKS